MESLVAIVLTLSSGGSSPYTIVLPSDATYAEKWAAKELKDTLKQMTGADLPIVTDDAPVSSAEIILGPNKHLAVIGQKIDFASLGREGYVIRTTAPHLILAGMNIPWEKGLQSVGHTPGVRLAVVGPGESDDSCRIKVRVHNVPGRVGPGRLSVGHQEAVPRGGQG